MARRTLALLVLSLAARAGAAQLGVSSQLPPVSAKLWDVAWKRQLVGGSLLEWRPEERGGPAVDPVTGLVLVGTRDGWLRAYDADGRSVWAFEAAGRFEAPARIDGELAYAGSSDGRLYAIEVATGKLRWKYDAQEEVGTTPVVAGGQVLVMTLQDTLVAVDAKTGAWKWHHRRETREGFTVEGAAAVVVTGRLALGAYSDGTVVALELDSGTKKWERRVAPAGDVMDVDGLCVQGGRVFAAAYSGGIYALELESGDQAWELKAPAASRVAAAANVLVAVTATQVLGVNPKDGAKLWSRPLEGGAAGVPLLMGRLAAVPNGKGVLWLDVASGRLLRLLDPGTGVSAPVARRDRRIYVLTNGGDLYALDLG